MDSHTVILERVERTLVMVVQVQDGIVMEMGNMVVIVGMEMVIIVMLQVDLEVEVLVYQQMVVAVVVAMEITAVWAPSAAASRCSPSPLVPIIQKMCPAGPALLNVGMTINNAIAHTVLAIRKEPRVKAEAITRARLAIRSVWILRWRRYNWSPAITAKPIAKPRRSA